MLKWEYLKEKYGLSNASAREKGAEVEREKLIAALKSASTDKPGLPAEHVGKAVQNRIKP